MGCPKREPGFLPPPGSLEKRNELDDNERSLSRSVVGKWSPHVRDSLEKFFENKLAQPGATTPGPEG